MQYSHSEFHLIFVRRITFHKCFSRCTANVYILVHNQRTTRIAQIDLNQFRRILRASPIIDFLKTLCTQISEDLLDSHTERQSLVDCSGICEEKAQI